MHSASTLANVLPLIEMINNKTASSTSVSSQPSSPSSPNTISMITSAPTTPTTAVSVTANITKQQEEELINAQQRSLSSMLADNITDNDAAIMAKKLSTLSPALQPLSHHQLLILAQKELQAFYMAQQQQQEILFANKCDLMKSHPASSMNTSPIAATTSSTAATPTSSSSLSSPMAAFMAPFVNSFLTKTALASAAAAASTPIGMLTSAPLLKLPTYKEDRKRRHSSSGRTSRTSKTPSPLKNDNNHQTISPNNTIGNNHNNNKSTAKHSTNNSSTSLNSGSITNKSKSIGFSVREILGSEDNHKNTNTDGDGELEDKRTHSPSSSCSSLNINNNDDDNASSSSLIISKRINQNNKINKINNSHKSISSETVSTTAKTIGETSTNNTNDSNENNETVNNVQSNITTQSDNAVNPVHHLLTNYTNGPNNNNSAFFYNNNPGTGAGVTASEQYAAAAYSRYFGGSNPDAKSFLNPSAFGSYPSTIGNFILLKTIVLYLI